MCGITAMFDAAGVDRHQVQVMTDAIAHRGPDGEGLWCDSVCGLGHRRLSIIDVDGSPQPMAIDGGRYHITFNGEIYNYKELRKTLDGGSSDSTQRHTFATQGDTEVVLRLYQRYGRDCVKHLRGMFAFVIYDSKERVLFAARDHLGQKPLYYAHTGSRLSLASEIKALLAAEPDLRELDDAALHEYLTLRIITPPRSMFRRIRKLAPGHCLEYRDGQLQISRYWDLSYTPKVSMGFEEACDALDAQIEEAVNYHLVADVSVGAFLSGGMDSSLIVHMMARKMGAGIKTFSGEIPYEGYSELPFSRLVSEQLQTINHEISIQPSLVSGLADLVWQLDEPSDPLSVCMFHISRLASQHVKVVLGGDGGDELFGGYDRYFGNQYASLYALIPQVLRRHVLSRLLKLMPEGGWYRSAGHQLRWMQQMANYEDGLRYGNSLSYFYCSDAYRRQLYTPEFAKRAAVFDPEAHIASHFDAANATDLLDRMLYADSNTRMTDHPVMILDRMSMAHGLEARAPFMDHKLAEFCASLPSEFKVKGRKLRRIQARLVERLLPSELLKRSKQGFSSPLPYVLADEFNQLYARLLEDSTLVSAGILQPDAIRQLVSQHTQGEADHGQRLWQLVNAESWYRMHIAGDGREGVHELINAA